jgi:hypothetical protein
MALIEVFVRLFGVDRIGVHLNQPVHPLYGDQTSRLALWFSFLSEAASRVCYLVVVAIMAGVDLPA